MTQKDIINLKRAVTRLVNAENSYRLCRADEIAKRHRKLARAGFDRAVVRIERLLQQQWR